MYSIETHNQYQAWCCGSKYSTLDWDPDPEFWPIWIQGYVIKILGKNVKNTVEEKNSLIFYFKKIMEQEEIFVLG